MSLNVQHTIPTQAEYTKEIDVVPFLSRIFCMTVHFDHNHFKAMFTRFN